MCDLNLSGLQPLGVDLRTGSFLVILIYPSRSADCRDYFTGKYLSLKQAGILIDKRNISNARELLEKLSKELLVQEAERPTAWPVHGQRQQFGAAQW